MSPTRLLSTCLYLLTLACAGAFSTLSLAQNSDSDEKIKAQLVTWDFQLDLIDDELKKDNITRPLLEALRGKLELMQQEMAAIQEQADVELKSVRNLLDALGPAPADDQPPEEDSVTQRRFKLEEQFAIFRGQQNQTKLTLARADQLQTLISKRLREQRALELLARGPSPLSGSVLLGASPYLLETLRQLTEAPLEKWSPVLARDDLSQAPRGPLLALLSAFVLLWPVRRLLLRRYVRDKVMVQPSFALKTLTAIMVGLARGVLPAMISGAPLLVLLNIEQQKGIAASMLEMTLGGVTFVLLVSGLARATLAPFSATGWRMTRLTHNSSSRLYRRIVALSWAAAIFMFIETLARRHLEIPTDLSIFYDFVADTVIAVFVLSLLPARLWRDRAKLLEEQEVNGVNRPAIGIGIGTIIRGLVAITALTIPVASVLGYANLSDFLTTNLFQTGVVLGLTIILHGLARDVTRVILERGSLSSSPAPGSDQADNDAGSGILHFWLVVAFDLLLVTGLAVILLTIWGVAWKDMTGWFVTLANGIKIGSFTFSFTDLLAAILVFSIILIATRGLQRLLENRIFPKTRLDMGVRNSLKTATGYTGLVIAVMLAISTVGLDLSNIAIIAGALSVGIGFGLQDVVNNFVSGLILLIERPVKVGDWIVVDTHEGYVKRINVRATEIQTFQRSSVIIPNSVLLSSALVNWTHKDTFARVDIPIGVAYGSDITLVRELLLDCARKNPKANPRPEPFVLFRDFGASSLDFELRFFISHAEEVFRVASEIRFAIDKTFRENNVEIPFPQTDVHVRSMMQPGTPGVAES